MNNKRQEKTYDVGFLVQVKRVTEKAMLLQIDGQEFWFPKSQIAEADRNLEPGYEGGIAVTEWIAKEKGFDINYGEDGADGDRDDDGDVRPELRR